MSNYLSINRKKYSAKTSLNYLLQENIRDEENAEHYDNGSRDIDTSQTSQNVVLLEPENQNIDDTRKRTIDDFNLRRSERFDDSKTPKENRANTRKLRADTVDTVGSVIQPSADFINSLDRDEQTQFFKDCFDVMKSDPKTYGLPISAVIHYDENTPHMQVLTSTLDDVELKSRAKEMFGNKTKMSNDQTNFVAAVKNKGWDIQRGVNRVNNPDYKNFKTEMVDNEIDVNRLNDHDLFQSYINGDSWQAQQKQNVVETLKTRKETEKQASEIIENAKIEAQQIIQEGNSNNANNKAICEVLSEEFPDEKIKDNAKHYVQKTADLLKNGFDGLKGLFSHSKDVEPKHEEEPEEFSYSSEDGLKSLRRQKFDDNLVLLTNLYAKREKERQEQAKKQYQEQQWERDSENRKINRKQQDTINDLKYDLSWSKQKNKEYRDYLVSINVHDEIEYPTPVKKENVNKSRNIKRSPKKQKSDDLEL